MLSVCHAPLSNEYEAAPAAEAVSVTASPTQTVALEGVRLMLLVAGCTATVRVAPPVVSVQALVPTRRTQ